MSFHVGITHGRMFNFNFFFISCLFDGGCLISRFLKLNEFADEQVLIGFS